MTTPPPLFNSFHEFEKAVSIGENITAKVDLTKAHTSWRRGRYFSVGKKSLKMNELVEELHRLVKSKPFNIDVAERILNKLNDLDKEGSRKLKKRNCLVRGIVWIKQAIGNKRYNRAEALEEITAKIAEMKEKKKLLEATSPTSEEKSKAHKKTHQAEKPPKASKEQKDVDRENNLQKQKQVNKIDDLQHQPIKEGTKPSPRSFDSKGSQKESIQNPQPAHVSPKQQAQPPVVHTPQQQSKLEQPQPPAQVNHDTPKVNKKEEQQPSQNREEQAPDLPHPSKKYAEMNKNELLAEIRKQDPKFNAMNDEEIVAAMGQLKPPVDPFLYGQPDEDPFLKDLLGGVKESETYKHIKVHPEYAQNLKEYYLEGFKQYAALNQGFEELRDSVPPQKPAEKPAEVKHEIEPKKIKIKKLKNEIENEINEIKHDDNLTPLEKIGKITFLETVKHDEVFLNKLKIFREQRDISGHFQRFHVQGKIQLNESIVNCFFKCLADNYKNDLYSLKGGYIQVDSNHPNVNEIRNGEPDKNNYYRFDSSFWNINDRLEKEIIQVCEDNRVNTQAGRNVALMCAANKLPKGKNLEKAYAMPLVVKDNHHYTMIFIDPKTKTIEYYDSMLITNDNPTIKQSLEDIKKFLIAYTGEKKWDIKQGITTACQFNGVDCGAWINFFAQKRLGNYVGKYKDEQGKVKPFDFNRINEFGNTENLMQHYRNDMENHIGQIAHEDVEAIRVPKKIQAVQKNK